MRCSRLLPTVAALTIAFLMAACGGDERPAPSASDRGAGEATRAPADEHAAVAHIHGLGVDPSSGTLYVATHYGLFQAPTGQTRLQRMGASRQDIMGFSVVGPRHFVGSGHPDPSQDLPPNLGLIESRDGGRRWRNVSLLGQADFHVLRSAGSRVYGVDSGTGALMVSASGGREWAQRTPPAATFDLAVDPSDSVRIVASTERGVFVSPNAGKGWRPLRADVAGLLAWPAPGRLFLVDGQGEVSRSSDAGKTFKSVGSIGGQPSAFVSHGGDLYAARPDGTVVRSTDGGATWALRATP
jgi:hypothetical protein